ncbi:MAG: AmmeMemoRadiSam system protein B [bacterium]|nr:AmmeMemoRadiSam system protein B [bacterium]
MEKFSTKFLIIILALLAVFQAGLIFITLKQAKNLNNFQISYDIDKLPTHYAYFSSRVFYDEAFEQGKDQIYSVSYGVYGGIIPHHLIVKDKIAAFLEGLSDNNYETVVLIGPNHFFAGDEDIIVSQAKWETPYGYLLPNLKLANILQKTEGVSVEEDPFIAEHSISGLVGFIKKSLPDVNFLPIIMKLNTGTNDITNLANTVYQNVDPKKTLVLASVDFSHYQPVAVADFHDQKSRQVIENFLYEQVSDLEIDSPPSIYALLKYLELAGGQSAKLLYSTNSGRLINDFDIPTTSHNFYYFTAGSKKDSDLTNFLFFGDIMLDRHVKEVMNKNGGVDYLLHNLAGEENRFFQGIDLISANLEGAVIENGAHSAPEMAYDFAFDPADVAVLKNYNFNFFTISNNHILDQGQSGFTETQVNLDKLGFDYTGCPDKKVDDCSVKIIDVNGKKIAMLGYSMVYGSLDEEKVTAQIAEVKNNSDLVIVNIHWGVEYESKHNLIQEKLAHQMIDSGADLIIGHHPHVVQDVEIYSPRSRSGEAGKNKPIFYSLGNFIFDQYFSRETQEGLSVGVNWGDDVFELALFPFYNEYSQARLMEGERREKWLEWLAKESIVEEEYKEQIKFGKINL